MFVVNFDFSNHFLPLKILAINIPVLLTELITYPLQRLQTLMVSQSYSILNKGQLKQTQLTLKNMIAIEGYPKLLLGMRYSVDYMGTQMTTKFLLFDYLINKTMNVIKSNQKLKLFANCFIANVVSTFVSQIAFNYQIIASSLPIDKKNRTEDIRITLFKYTEKKKIPIDGLKYTIPISIINTAVEMFILNYIANTFGGNSSISYTLLDQLTAFTIFSITAFFSHYAFQRQVQICLRIPQRSIPYTKGLISSILRYNIKGMLLFSFYLLYFEMKTKYQLESLLPKKTSPIPSPYSISSKTTH